MTDEHDAPSIGVVGLTKEFGPVRALDDVSFHVRGGRVTGFLGHNGSGKTTTMRAMLGLTATDAGTCTFTDRHGAVQRRPVVAWASEKCGIQPGRTGRAHLRAAAAFLDVPRAAADQALRDAGLQEVADKRIGKYSTGMRRRLSLAEVAITPSDWVLLDEPLNGLDPEGVQWMRSQLRSMAADGKAVLVSSHLLNEAERYVDDVVLLSKGQVLFTGSLTEWRSTFGTRTEIKVEDARDLEHLVTDLGVWVTDVDRVTVPEEDVEETLRRLHDAHIGAQVVGPARISLEAMYNGSIKG